MEMQSYKPRSFDQTQNDGLTWDNVSTALGVINPTLGAVSQLGQLVHGYFGGKEQRKAQHQIQERQENFQREMSNTAHQRQMADMRSAGLNPILSAKYGGSSTPAGSTFKPENKALQYAHLTQALAAAQASVNSAKNLGYQAQMSKMDLDGLRKSGMYPMLLKHTPFNYWGSKATNIFEDGIHSAKNLVQNLVDPDKQEGPWRPKDYQNHPDWILRAPINEKGKRARSYYQNIKTKEKVYLK